MKKKYTNTKFEAIPERMEMQIFKLSHDKGFKIRSIDDNVGYIHSKKLIFVSPLPFLKNVPAEDIKTWNRDSTFQQTMYIIDGFKDVIIEPEQYGKPREEVSFY